MRHDTSGTDARPGRSVRGGREKLFSLLDQESQQNATSLREPVRDLPLDADLCRQLVEAANESLGFCEAQPAPTRAADTLKIRTPRMRPIKWFAMRRVRPI